MAERRTATKLIRFRPGELARITARAQACGQTPSLHGDRHPSCRLNEAKNTWYCDPCGEGGNPIRLVERALGVKFWEAVRWLA
jgi:hypothetical protein